MANTYSAGIVTAYGAAKRGGYTGTYDEFCAEQANFGIWAQQVREDKESVEQTVETFIETTVPNAVQSVEDKGTEQIGLVGNAGTTQIQNVNEAGSTQVGNVQNEGTTQVNRVQDKGDEVLDSIPQDYSELVDDVADLTRQISDIDSAFDEIVFESVPANHAIITNDNVIYKDSDMQITYNQNGSVNFQYPYDLGNPFVRFALTNIEEGKSYTFTCNIDSGRISDLRIDRLISTTGGVVSNIAIATLNDNKYSVTFTGISVPVGNVIGITISFMRSLSTDITLSNFVCTDNDEYSAYFVKNSALKDIPESALDNQTQEKIDKASWIDTEISTTLTNGYLDESGGISSPSSNQEKTTNKIDCRFMQSIIESFNFSDTYNMWVAHGIWYSNGTFERTVDCNNLTGSSFTKKIEIPENAVYIAISFRSFGESPMSVNSEGINIQNLMEVADEQNYNKAFNPFRYCHVYDHLFVDIPTPAIPAESLEHVRLSHRFGFQVIEANTAKTSDNQYIVYHATSSNGTLVFGNAVEHIDGETDISSVAINTKTMAWIKENVRYKSSLVKYKTELPTIEEFCVECKKNCIIPIVEVNSDSNLIDLVDELMGKNNWMAYGASRAMTDGMILHWAGENTVAEVKTHFDDVQAPFVYCMSTPSRFTDEQLKEIVEYGHSIGCLIATAYVSEVEWQRDLSLGFDALASRWDVPYFESGNIENISCDISFSGITTTGAVDSDNNLVLDNGDTITYSGNDSTCIYKYLLSVVFDGEISLSMGRISETFESNGEIMTFSAYSIFSVPSFTLTSVGETTIKSLVFKLSAV